MARDGGCVAGVSPCSSPSPPLQAGLLLRRPLTTLCEEGPASGPLWGDAALNASVRGGQRQGAGKSPGGVGGRRWETTSVMSAVPATSSRGCGGGNTPRPTKAQLSPGSASDACGSLCLSDGTAFIFIHLCGFPGRGRTKTIPQMT